MLLVQDVLHNTNYYFIQIINSINSLDVTSFYLWIYIAANEFCEPEVQILKAGDLNACRKWTLKNKKRDY